ncbi:MAG TPA: DUF3311 domain-containing protein [Gemmatimonadaceae bacterium]|nr:DUF3311 domain-containing protein [Gemmatimonadaceae bacterium]
MKARPHHALALLPPLALFVGVPLLNRSAPGVLGWPPLMTWMVAWVALTALVMGVIYLLDRRRGDDGDA